ncbi:MAG: NAD(P)/FAD-dependent oxidoreductase, partial [Synechococcaceae cyanobacterium RL_1_2]|nr:NAD(P)/FAD-dependent oxidoreductase [Synechococcaceae cyanobacterium RL_1_2]
GRCNVTHSCFEPEQLMQNYPRGHQSLRGAMTRFQPRDTVQWFQDHGVQLKTESDGRMFPVTNESQTIIDCLLNTAKRHRVKVQTSVVVRSVTYDAEVQEFSVLLKDGDDLKCDRLLLATGSHPSGYRIAKSLGHRLESPVPSLFTFQISDQQLRALAGVSVQDVHLSLKVGSKTLKQEGALLITHWGVSGPAILKLSAWGARDLHEAKYQSILRINWLPQEKPDQLRTYLSQLKQDWSRRQIATHNPVSLPMRLWQYFVVIAEIKPGKRWADLSKKELNKLLQILTQCQFAIVGKGVFKDEFVTCGGIKLKEVNFKTMESRVCPGLYLAGELLDVDGVTGGFNFQNAWTTGWLAGQTMGL